MSPESRLPDRLYKYRSTRSDAVKYTEDIFRGNRVWYAQASTFNDPFDCDHYIDVDRDSDEWREIMQRFSERFSQATWMGVGLLGQFLYNRIAEGLNQNPKRKKKLPLLSDERLVELTRRAGQRSELTFSGRKPVDLVGEDGSGTAGLNAVLYRYLEESKDAVDECYGVYCLAERSDNILMWSHYADDHSGICIEFDTGDQPDAFPNIHPVDYTEESPVIEKRFANLLMNVRDNAEEVDGQLLARLAREDVAREWTDQEVRKWFLTKSTLWEYEREWRSIASGYGLRRIPAATISGVVLGVKASAETEEAVRSWVKRRRRKVTISRAHKRKGAFALDVVPV